MKGGLLSVFEKRQSNNTNQSMRDEQQVLNWQRIGGGGFKSVYKNESMDLSLIDSSSYKGPWTMQVNHNDAQSPLTITARQLRLLKAMNPEWADDVGLHHGRVIKPYVEGRQATDKEAAAVVLDVFCRTKRIFLDAMMPGNVLVKNRRYQIIDVDMLVRHDSVSSREHFGFFDAPRVDYWANRLLKQGCLQAYAYYSETQKMIRRLCRLVGTYGDDIPEVLLTPDALKLISASKTSRLSENEINAVIHSELLSIQVAETNL